MALHRFEDFFHKYGKGRDGLTLNDLWDALKGQRLIFDPIGWMGTAAACERIPLPHVRLFFIRFLQGS